MVNMLTIGTLYVTPKASNTKHVGQSKDQHTKFEECNISLIVVVLAWK